MLITRPQGPGLENDHSNPLLLKGLVRHLKIPVLIFLAHKCQYILATNQQETQLVLTIRLDPSLELHKFQDFLPIK